MFVQRFSSYAWLDDAVQIFFVDCNYPVHLGKFYAYSSSGSVDLSLKRCSGSKRNHWNGVFRARRYDGRDLIGIARRNYGVRRLVRDPSGRVAVLFPKRCSGVEPVAESMSQYAANRLYSGFVSFYRS